MATTSNTFTGNGSTKTYSFTFPYLATTDIKIQLTTAAGVDKDITAYTLPSATSITFTALGGSATDWQETTGAPKSGVTILIYRDTDSSTLSSTFYSGSAIRSSDLNDNFTQNLYVTQEAEVDVAEAKTDAASAKTTATTANTTANTANTTANTANTNATNAVSTANTASTNATTAVNTANTASTNATNAVNTANAASAAVSTVLPYTIVANKAALLAASVSEDDIYEVTDTTDMEDLGDSDDVIWVNTAGATSGQDIAALKPSVTWDSGITLKMKKYGTNNSDRKWIFQSYFANDPETKYFRSAGDTMTGNIVVDNAKEVRLSEADSNGAAYVGLKGPTDMGAASSYTVTLPSATPTANQILKADASTPTTLTWAADSATDATKMPLAGGTFTGAVNLGVDDTGVDCKFFGDTASAYLLWDTSADSLLTGGSATIDIVKDKLKIGGTAVTTTAAELNLLDGKTVVGDATKAGTNAWTGVNSNEPETLSSASNITIDFSTSNNFKLETGHAAIAFDNPTTEIPGQSGSIFITQGSTTCAAPTWGNQYFFAGGTAPSLTGTTGKVARIDYIVQEAGKIHCVATDDLLATS